jgi:DNA-binding Lrp family transcriptional regulator
MDELDKLIRRITVDVFKKHNVVLTAIGVYSYNTKDPEAVAVRERVSQIVTANPNVLQMHGFNLNQANKEIRFDIVVSFDAEDRRQVYREVCENVQKEYPDYTLQIQIDMDFSEGSSAEG